MNKDKIMGEINEELKRANEIYELFNSRHEAYSVIKEEYEEFYNEVKDIEIGLQDYWNIVKKTKLNKNSNEALVAMERQSVVGDKQMEILLDHLENAVLCAVQELIQVGAMIQKAKLFENGNEDKKNNE